MVLVHEIQHGNQYKFHKMDSSFFNEHGYWNHASEREARSYADEKLNEIGYIVPGLGDAGDRLYGTAAN